MDIEKLSNILGAETVKKIYDDVFSEPGKELGKALTDIIKGLRLFTAPFQYAATFQDRLTKYLEKVRNSVPEENQIEALPSISGPIIERLKYLEDENYLIDLYLNLLSRAIDKERINEAHPAFIRIIEQLSPDEALFLHKLKDGEIIKKLTFEYRYYAEESEPIIETDIPPSDFTFGENLAMYMSHLESLNLILPAIKNGSTELIEDPAPADNPIGGLKRSIEITTIKPTEFGKLFIKACVPDNLNQSNFDMKNKV